MAQTPQPAQSPGRLARWLALPRDERRFGMISAVIAGPVLGCFRLRGFTGALAAIDRTPRARRAARIRPSRAEVITRRVFGVLRVPQRCLPVALVQYATHRARREDVAFVIGVRKDKKLDLRGAVAALDFDAHAWVEDADDRSSGGGYVPIYRFDGSVR
jgi:hypothetical protein